MKAILVPSSLLVMFGVLMSATPARACSLPQKSRPLSRAAVVRLQRAFARADHSPARRPGSERVPLGGTDAGKRNLESRLGNAAEDFFAEVSAAAGVARAAEVQVAVPVAFNRSGYSPFGDEQTNAEPSLRGWAGARPPVLVGIYPSDTPAGGAELHIQWDAALPLKQNSFNAFSGGAKICSGTAQPGATASRCSVPGPAGQALLRGERELVFAPEGWADGFTVRFAREAWPTLASFRAALAPAARQFADGRSALDPEQLAAPPQTATKAFARTAWGAGYNVTPYEAPNVHGRYPNAEGRVTAVGRVWTWLAQPPIAPFKHLYTCFERRRLDLENESGAPSGAGWHLVGAPAETVLNSLEDVAIPAALGLPTRERTASGQAAWGLDSVMIYRPLRPGEAFITRAGEFHWYANVAPREACTEILVHACVPSAANGMGFSCP